MVHHITKVEEVTFMVHEIAILKHPNTLPTKEEWKQYRKLASSYIRHRNKVFLVVRRFDEWRNHSYDRDHENMNALYSNSAGTERYEEDDFLVHQEVESQDGGADDDEEGYEMLDDYERETIELQKEVANLEHPSARIELQLLWTPTIDGGPAQQAEETRITSPYVLKLNNFIARNATCTNAGGAAFEIEHTDREVELSFRHPLEGPEYYFRKVRIFFHENEEMQDFLSRIDVLIGVRRSKTHLRLIQDRMQETTQAVARTERREERQRLISSSESGRRSPRLRRMTGIRRSHS